MPIDIDALSEAELVDLNHRIVERLRFLHQIHAHQTMLKFSIGDRVTFEDGQGRKGRRHADPLQSQICDRHWSRGTALEYRAGLLAKGGSSRRLEDAEHHRTFLNDNLTRRP